jgi:hypothetical protein
MSLHPDQLEDAYKDIECQRRQNDSIYDFFFFDSAKREPWVSQAVELVLRDFASQNLSLIKENQEFLYNLMDQGTREDQICFWLMCLNMYPDVKNFVMTSDDVQRVELDALAYFLEQVLPVLCDSFCKGAYSSVKAFVRTAFAEYCFTVPCIVA